jgi:hypothetical protein
MEATPDYLGMRIAGGGYAEPTVVGDLWPGRDGRSGLMTWNNFDIPGCDGIPEPLTAGRALMVCGEGGASINDQVIVSQMDAEVFIETNGKREKVCGDSQRFTFTRATP